MSEPDRITVVLTFVDSDGRRWLAGAHMGPLVAEDDTTQHMEVRDMPDKAIALLSFAVVRDGW